MSEQAASTGLYERAEHAARVIRSRTSETPRVAIVLGSGLGAFADDFEDAVGIPYEEIPGFPRSTAQGHAGRLVVGKIDQVPMLAMQGRVHYYEGYPLETVVFEPYPLGALGVELWSMVYFKGREKGLALNITNVKTVGSMYGFVAADWVGKRITIYPTTTTFGSATVDCIRVKVGVPGAKAQDAPPDPPPAPTEGDPPFDDANGGAP